MRNKCHMCQHLLHSNYNTGQGKLCVSSNFDAI